MLPRKFFWLYVLVLAATVLLTLLVYPKTIRSKTVSKYDSLRQILQFRTEVASLVASLTTAKYVQPYVSPTRNDTGNVPEGYFDDNLAKPTGHNKTCAKHPDIFDLRFKNDYWQIQKTGNGTLHLFNAYLDLRNNTVVRILASYDVYRSSEKLYCQLWYSGNTFRIVESEDLFWLFIKGWGADNGNYYHPYVVTCPVQMVDGRWPSSVSLVDQPCQNPSNNLQIHYKDFEQRKNFVVCVKGLSFPYEDISARLAEWIELVNILGAEKINFYEFSVHPNTQRVLDYYVSKGIIEVTPLSLVGDFSNRPRLQNKFLHSKTVQRRLQEVIPYNDCLYKHLEEFKYVVLLDTDEVIVPFNGTWIELLNTLGTSLPGMSSYVARNIYFLDEYLHQHDWFDGVPKYMHMLQHVFRMKNFTKPGYFVKGFHDTRQVTALHNHYPFACLHGCSAKEIDIKLAQLQHYRADCAAGVSNCKEMKTESLADFTIWNYKDELIARVERTMKELDLLDS